MYNGSRIIKNMNNIGAFQIARQIFESDLWLNKPSSWTKIWIYILGKVNHTDNKFFKRGSNIFNFTRDHKLIGDDITNNIVKKFLIYSKRTNMIRTEKTTRGVVVYVLNYNNFQTLDNYKQKYSSGKSQLKPRIEEMGTTESIKNDDILDKKSDINEFRGTTEEPERNYRGTTIIKNDKNDKNVINSKQSLRTNDVNKIMDEFYQINPTLNWGNKTQRKAVEDLLSKYPLDTLIGMLTWYKKQMTDKFCPVATTPLAFKNKLGDIKAYADKLKSNSLVTNIKI